MAENFSSDSSVVSVLYNLDSTYTKGSIITITDSEGNALFVTSSVKSFNSILFASDKLEVGDTVTIQIDDDSFTYSIEDTISSYGSAGMNKDMGSQGGNFDPNSHGPSDFNGEMTNSENSTQS